ncbi:hypothetical protein MSG28_010494 [Choristoneura fumiferana]|uniref:Uncharacterized protein n=1 Tax=Choristoneura fumiferana TaxID=7141 RepID=A0ACC0KLI5_CHOFU|nr:hypothetical protein MSG28_010494 [Choristoneura fumiferana]
MTYSSLAWRGRARWARSRAGAARVPAASRARAAPTSPSTAASLPPPRPSLGRLNRQFFLTGWQTSGSPDVLHHSPGVNRHRHRRSGKTKPRCRARAGPANGTTPKGSLVADPGYLDSLSAEPNDAQPLRQARHVPERPLQLILEARLDHQLPREVLQEFTLETKQLMVLRCRLSRMFLERLLFCVFCLGIEVVVQGLAEEAALREVAVDKGTNVTIPCGGLLTLPTPNVQWVYKGNRTHHEVLLDGSLVLLNVRVDYAGVYECSVENETAFVDRINVTVRTEPPPLVNVSVHASTILALILWSVAGDGGHPIIDFTAQYRSAAPVNGSLEPWRPISPNHISPNSRQIDVYHLDTNASYWFRVWANNALGAGPPVEVLATTLFTDQEAVGTTLVCWVAASCAAGQTSAAHAAIDPMHPCEDDAGEELYKHFFTGTEGFDTRTWLAAVCVVMGTLTVLAAGTCAVLCREWRRDGETRA